MKEYNSNLINIDQRIVYISDLISYLRKDTDSKVFNSLTLETPSNRNSNIIESILIRIPLPIIWLDNTGGNKDWYALSHHNLIDSISNFIEDNYLLKDLEYLTNLEGKSYSELPGGYRRRLIETRLNVCLISTGTPPDYKLNIIKRFQNFEH